MSRYGVQMGDSNTNFTSASIMDSDSIDIITTTVTAIEGVDEFSR